MRRIRWSQWLILGVSMVAVLLGGLALHLNRLTTRVQKDQAAYHEPFLLPDLSQPVEDDYFDRRDEIWRKRIAGMSMPRLLTLTFNLTSASMDDPANPEIFVRKAMVGEEMTRADGERGLSGWNRAEVSYLQAIDRWRALDGGRNLHVTERRLQTLTRAYEEACKKQGKQANVEQGLRELKEIFKLKFPPPDGPDV